MRQAAVPQTPHPLLNPHPSPPHPHSRQPHRVVYDPIWDVAGYVGYHPGWKAVVLSFRGTDSSNWGNWAENMRAWRTDHMYPEPGFPHALIHAGFYSLWTASSMQGAMTAAVSELMAAHPGSRLVATGHSMGGALAQLAGLELKFAHNASRVTVFTFGAPRVGNLAYQQVGRGGGRGKGGSYWRRDGSCGEKGPVPVPGRTSRRGEEDWEDGG